MIEYRCYGQTVRGLYIPANSVVFQKNGVILVCVKFPAKGNTLDLYVYSPKRGGWYKTVACDNYTAQMAAAYRKRNRRMYVNTRKLMAHDRVHKHGTGGTVEHVNAITDYECSKNPLHDFRRSFV